MGVPDATTGHVGLNVTDLERSTAFYRRVFEFASLLEQTDGDRRFAILGHDGSPVLTLWQQSSGTFTADTPGLHHLSFVVPDMDAVERAAASLRDIGATFVHDGVVSHGEGMASGGIFFTDPDGIRLEIYATTGAETAPVPTPAGPTCGLF
jgi:catechol-2,3-dioxygenase